MPDYMLGTSDPPLGHDPGAGPWNSKPTEVTMLAAKLAVQSHLGECVVFVGWDASQHMAHYLGNTGLAYTIRLRSMVNDVPSARRLYDEELEAAKAFAQTLPDGSHSFTSARGINGYNRQSESRNWFFAIGGYTVWGKGSVSISTGGGTRSFAMRYEYRFYDRYNWDGGKSVTLAGITITDEFMGEFHRQGLAMEFDCFGSMTDTVSWSLAAPPPSPVPPVVPPSPGPGPKPPPGPGPAPGTGPTVYTVVAGDYLSKIAQRFYGNSSLWPRIYEANKGVIGPNPNLIHPGQKLVIP